jgi:hypothetical protein
VNPYRAKLKQKYPDCWQWIRLARRFPGRLTENEASLLFHLARARTPAIHPVIVELEAFQGKTALLLAAGLREKTRPRVVSFQRTGAAQTRFQRNIERCRLAVETTVADPRHASAAWNDNVDILFINATEDGEALRNHLSVWLPFVAPGGIVALHGTPDPSSALFPPPGYDDFRLVDRLAWAAKPRSDAAVTGWTAPPSAALDHNREEVEALRRLLNRSMEGMLRLNAVPLVEERSTEQVADLADTAEIAIARVQDYVRRAAKEMLEHRRAIRSLRLSWSWRLTAPVRWAVDTMRAIWGVLGSFGQGSPNARLFGLAQWVLFARQVRASGLWDERYYRANHPGASWAKASSLLHFFVCGASDGKKPNELFDTRYYLARYPDVASSGVNPLVHYLKSGAYEGRDPHPHFESSFYLEQNPDVRAAGLNPLAHYLAPGVVEGRDPNPWFDTSEYLEQNPDVVIFGLNPLAHQVERWSEQRLCSR